MARRYENIPEVIATYHDNQLVQPRAVPSTGNVTIADFALWGPVNEPVTVDTITQGQKIFGAANGAYGDVTRARGYNGNILSRALTDVIQAGNRNVTLTRLDFGGVAASTELLFVTDSEASTAEEVVTDGASTPVDLYIALTFDTMPDNVYDGGGAWFSWQKFVYTYAKDGDTWETTPTGDPVALTGTGNVGVDTNLFVVQAINTDDVQVWLDPSDDYDPNETADTTYLDAQGDETTEELAVTKEVTRITRTWFFAVGVTIAGAYPGLVGNSIGYKVAITTDSADLDYDGDLETYAIATLSVRSPEEFGAFTYTFTSDVCETLGDLLVKANRELADVATLALSHGATSDMVTADIVNAAVVNTVDNVEVNNGFYGLGTSITATSSIATVITAGTDCVTETWSGRVFPKNPGALGVTAAMRRKWYALALGNPLDVNDDNKALAMLRGEPVGVITVPNLYIDELCNAATGAILPYIAGQAKAKNALQYLLDFAHLQNGDGIGTMVVTHCTPLANTSNDNINTRYNFLRTVEFMNGALTTQDDESETTDAGRYLSVVAGPSVMVMNREIGAYPDGGALQYAAMLTILPLNDPPSMNAVPGVMGLAYTFGRRKMSALSGGQGQRETGGSYVVLGTAGVGAYVNLAKTAAAATSDYTKVHNFRIATGAGALVRTAIRPFLGKAFGLEQWNAMDTAIESKLLKLVDAGVLAGNRKDGFDFDITQTPAESVLGEASVTLWLRPNFELDWVRVNVSLRA